MYATEESQRSELPPHFRLHNSRVEGGGGTEQGRLLVAETTVQFLKLARMPSRIPDPSSISDAGYSCRFAAPIYPWHLSMFMTGDGLNALCHRVSVSFSTGVV